MTQVLITVDTELSAGRHAAGMPLVRNFDLSFSGLAGGREYGAPWLMEQMDRRGIKGVFFVDPMPGLVCGGDTAARMVEPILARGHEVQLHIHTEWLAWAGQSPVDGRQGQSIGDFSPEDQLALIGWARDALVAAGAPPPTAFRAGNFGANDDTLAALARLGLRWDSSFNPGYAGGLCRIALPRDMVDPVERGGVIEAPVAGIEDMPGHFRPAQVCALSTGEMRQGLDHAAASGAHSVVAVTHSFEMLSRDRQRPNRLVMKRFAALCDAIAADTRLQAVTFATLREPVPGEQRGNPGRLAPNRARTLARIAEQAWANWRYERRLMPG